MALPKKKSKEEYYGFEQGPIRPPSEAYSLLIRVTRNCPWNHCTFCPVYKGERFSLRSVDHVKKDIDSVKKYVYMLRDMADKEGRVTSKDLNDVVAKTDANDMQAFHAAGNWMSGGMRSIFIQDANSLIIKPENLIELLTYIKDAFPWVERITSYARSHTVARIKDEYLKDMAMAGLNRIHIGLESGSDNVLKMVRKGATKDLHIKAGLKVKKAGIELSEYVMPGLGGVEYSKEHALETADVLNQVNADFIRLRSLAIPNHVALFKEYESGRFKKCTDLMMCKEILTFIGALDGVSSSLKSDHMLNLFQDVEGKLPEHKEKMMNILQSFIDFEPEKQVLYQVGSRLGIFTHLGDLNDPVKAKKAENVCQKNGITPENSDEIIEEIMKRFI
jgi:histone acetyltransferase (RNA polymerase elongator complex component)